MAIRSRLAVILHADIVGSTRLVQHDESIAHERFQDAFRRLSDVVSAFGGVTLERRGDALVAEFGRASGAACAALSFQSANRAHNESIPDPIRPEVRVGIALGEPGVKGFSEPIRVYSAGLREGAAVPRPSGDAVSSARPSSPAAGPSIAVLPFSNLSGDPEQALFAEGMTEDLTTDLSKVSQIFVVSRASCLAYEGKQVDIKRVGEEVGVSYILQGSVRRAADRVRINAQLSEAGSGRQVWADRCDGLVTDVFELQDAVGREVVSALSVELTQGERERLERVHTRNLDAYELFVRAKATPYPPVPARIENARQMFEQVIALDPEFAGGYSGVSAMLGLAAAFDHADPAPRVAQALALARKAIEVDGTFGWSHAALALALLHRGEHDEAIASGRKAIEYQPSDADAYSWLGWVLGFSGRIAESLATIEQAIRLNPLFVNGPYLNLKSMIEVVGGDYEAAISTHEENVRRQGPIGPPALTFAAAAMAALGRIDDAAGKAAELRERFPAFRLGGWNCLALLRAPDDQRRIHDLMVEAGVPR